jgi:hypothetical protein
MRDATRFPWIQYLPSASVAAVILASVFNVGYFLPIGLHFLGVMDFSNVVYSLGLAFLFVLAAIGVAPTLAEVGIDRIIAFQKTKIAVLLVLLYAVCFMGSLIAAVLMFAEVIPTEKFLGLRVTNFVVITVFLFGLAPCS